MTRPHAPADGRPDESRRAPRARSGDLLAGLLTAGFGTAVVIYVQGFPSLAGGYPGPALFPGIIGGLMVVFGLTLVLRPRRATGDGDKSRASAPSARSWRGSAPNASAVLLAVVVYLLVVDVLGFLLTMAALLFLLMLKLGTRVIVALPASVAATLVIYAFFRGLLLVPLPPGLLG